MANGNVLHADMAPIFTATCGLQLHRSLHAALARRGSRRPVHFEFLTIRKWAGVVTKWLAKSTSRRDHVTEEYHDGRFSVVDRATNLCDFISEY